MDRGEDEVRRLDIRESPGCIRNGVGKVTRHYQCLLLGHCGSSPGAPTERHSTINLMHYVDIKRSAGPPGAAAIVVE